MQFKHRTTILLGVHEAIKFSHGRLVVIVECLNDLFLEREVFVTEVKTKLQGAIDIVELADDSLPGLTLLMAN
jgi:hypothetical protein